jgi:hypothetical protein
MGFFSKAFVPAKAMVSNDFLQAIGKAKKEVQTNLDTNTDLFDKSYAEAVELFHEYQDDQLPEMLEESAKQFIALIRDKPSRVEPYAYMALIMYSYGSKDEALLYIKISEDINKDYKMARDVKNFLLTN